MLLWTLPKNQWMPVSKIAASIVEMYRPLEYVKHFSANMGQQEKLGHMKWEKYQCIPGRFHIEILRGRARCTRRPGPRFTNKTTAHINHGNQAGGAALDRWIVPVQVIKFMPTLSCKQKSALGQVFTAVQVSFDDFAHSINPA
jgi:hypothetical protein